MLWLIKDCCWMLEWKVPGTLMIFPTLAVAIYIVIRSRDRWMLFLPNLAVVCWISANISWMLFDFYAWNSKPPALVLFISGMIIITVYVILYFKRKYGEEEEDEPKISYKQE